MSQGSVLAAGSLFAGDVCMYVAPVDRAGGGPVAFDAAVSGRFALDAPPAGWMRVGSVVDVTRDAGDGLHAVWSGAPATVKVQARAKVQELVDVTFPAWTRLAMALSAGTQTMNLLAGAAEVVGAGSTASVLQLASSTAVQVGDAVVVDADYDGATGYVGAGAAGTYVAATPASVDTEFARRVSFNVGRVKSVAEGAVTLTSPLPAGVPDAGMKVRVVKGFADRNGGSFLQEWSALFVVDGFQGDRLLLHYPRLQPAGDGAVEVRAELAQGVTRWRPKAKLRALPVRDPLDGAAAVSFRTYLPAPMRQV